MKKIKLFFVRLFYGLLSGLKKADSEMFLGKNSVLTDSNCVEQLQEENIGKDLLKGEVTQAVEDLRYSTYSVYRESNNYEYLGDGIAIKKDVKKIDINNLSFVQKNKLFCQSVLETLDDVDEEKDKFTLVIVYNTTSRFRLERFIEYVFVNIINGVATITFKFARQYDIKTPMTRMFYNELEKLVNNERHNEIFNDNLKSLCFTTYKAQGENDFVMYVFDYLQPLKYEVFDSYINVSYQTQVFNREDLTSKYFSQNQQEKYDMHSVKNTKMGIWEKHNDYKCSECGEIMNKYDYQITLNDFGKSLCVKCLEKYLTFGK